MSTFNTNLLLSLKTGTKNFVRLLFVLTLLYTLQSCSIQKRHYLSGYSFNWKGHGTKVEPTLNQITEKKHNQTKKETLPEINSQKSDIVTEQLITASSQKKAKIILDTKQILPTKLFDACDTLVMNTGIQILVKVTQVSKTQIEYRLCNDLNGEIKIAHVKDIACVKYANGQKEYFTESQRPPTYEEQQQMIGSQIKNRANAALVLAILSYPLMFFGGIGIITALIAHKLGKRTLYYTKQNPAAYYKYANRADTAITLAKILLYISLIFFAIIFVIILLAILIYTGKI